VTDLQKLIGFPLAIMLILSMITFISGGDLSSGTVDVENGGSINVNGTSGSVEIPRAERQTFNIWGPDGAIVILVALLAVGIVAGISVFGSGLSGTSQRMIILGTGLFGIWACLTVATTTIFQSGGVFGGLMWVGLTIMYVLGFVQASTGGDVDG
jgi:hypothetical protein